MQNNRYSRFILHTHPSAFLLAAQLVLLFLYAAFEGLQSERAMISLFGIVVLVLRVWAIRRSPGIDWVAWLLAIPAFVLALLAAFNINTTLLVWEAIFEAALYFYAAASLIAYMMEDYQVTPDELFAAGATFTLLAWGFAYLYLICHLIIPGSFFSSINTTQSYTFIEFLSLSFTNLSATGLSDITPASPTARAFVMLEQFVGVGYVAMVVSRLVGLTIQRQKARRQGEG